jgi:hypothetical protein
VLVWAGHAVEQSTTPPPDEKQQHDNVVPLRRAKKSEGAM